MICEAQRRWRHPHIEGRVTSWSERGPQLAQWDEAFAADDEGQSNLQRALDQVITEFTSEHGQIASKKIHDRDFEGVPVEYGIQPLQVTVWLYPDQVSLHREDGRRGLLLESVDLVRDWAVPGDFAADFRQVLYSLLTDGNFEYRHLREKSIGEKAGDATAGIGCLAVVLLLWFTLCG